MRKSIVTIDILGNTVHPVPGIMREAAVFLFLLYRVGKESRERHRKIQSVNLISGKDVIRARTTIVFAAC